MNNGILTVSQINKYLYLKVNSDVQPGGDMDAAAREVLPL